MQVKITRELFARYHDQDILKYVMTTESGFRVVVLNYGGIIWEIDTLDRYNRFANVVVNHRQFNPQNPGHLGAITGRVAGRIKNSQFTLGGKNYQLSPNESTHTLHGGNEALDKKIWQVLILDNGIELNYFSVDGESGFVGNVNFTVRYLIEEDQQLTIEAIGVTDTPTPINLTNHSYFNLTGDPKHGSRQLLRIDSNRYIGINSEKLFIRELEVANTPFDFRLLKPITQNIYDDHQQLSYGNGYDHGFILNQSKVPIELIDNQSGRFLRVVYTTEPLVILYSANHFEAKFSALCLETQRLLFQYDSYELFADKLCTVDMPYYSKTIWKFGVQI